MNVKKIKTLGLIMLIFFIGFAAGISSFFSHQNATTNGLQKQYSLLSKRILIENPNDILLDFQPLKQDIGNYIDTNVGTDKISFYFEYLPTGSSIGINEDNEVVGASLLKLPVVIKIYKYAEEGKINLSEEVALKKEWLNNGYGQLYKKGPGYKLTIREATDYAIEKSDNTALLLLFDKISKVEETKSPSILNFVDASYETNKEEQILIGARSYSSILKCLYFACYLNKNDSQQVLHSLTLGESKERLPLHIPESVLIAHKIGTYNDRAQSDCGIFYVDKRNYLLCVMINGEDPSASRYIADLSKIVYESVSSNKN